MSLSRRTANAIGWRSAASIVQVVVLFARSIVLARLLPVEVFGIFAGVVVIKQMTMVFAGFGLDAAFMHRSAMTEDEDVAAAQHFTLRMMLMALWLLLIILFAMFAFEGVRRTALITIACLALLNVMTATPRIILRRRVVHRRLSLIAVVTDIASAVVAIAVALWSPTIWAILANEVVIVLVPLIMLYVWRPVWRPRLMWSQEVVGYYVDFGRKMVGANALLNALDKVDDLWTSLVLGDYALGLYSRAFTFATYPRKVLAMPVNAVALGSYAELKGNRHALSQMFVRLNSLLVRAGFLLAGLLALVAPEFIRITIGAKWLPFLDAFRLMLIYTLFDPIKITIGDLFVALGLPTVVFRVRLMQLAVLAVGLFVLGRRFDIAGVAIATNLMLVCGIVALLFEAKRHIDFSVRAIFFVPTVALCLGFMAGRAVIMVPSVMGADWRTGLAKSTVYLLTYVGFLLWLDRGIIRQLWTAGRHMLR